MNHVAGLHASGQHTSTGCSFASSSASATAHEHWLRVLRQWEELNRRVPGKVDLRVAVLQYFLRSLRK